MCFCFQYILNHLCLGDSFWAQDKQNCLSSIIIDWFILWVLYQTKPSQTTFEISAQHNGLWNDHWHAGRSHLLSTRLESTGNRVELTNKCLQDQDCLISEYVRCLYLQHKKTLTNIFAAYYVILPFFEIHTLFSSPCTRGGSYSR